MADKADTYQASYELFQQAEDAICERTWRRLQEHAEVMGCSMEDALADVIPATRKRLVAYLARTRNAEAAK